MKYKILITDFDGTLSCGESSISIENLKAINEFISRGGIFCVCTGRMRMGILHVLDRYCVKGVMACFNGAEVINLDTKEIIVNRPILNADAVELLEEIQSCGAYVQAYYDNKLIIDHRTENTSAYEKMSNIVATVVDQKLSEHFKLVKKNTSKLLVFDDPKIIDATYEVLQLKFGQKFKIVRSNPVHIEITHPDVSKASAVDAIANYYGYTAKDVVAVGDAGNDCAMLMRAGLGIAVSNAEEVAKQSADVVLEISNEQNAIKFVIDNYCV